MFNYTIRSIAVTHLSKAVAGCAPLKFWKHSRIVAFVSMRRRLGPDPLGLILLAPGLMIAGSLTNLIH